MVLDKIACTNLMGVGPKVLERLKTLDIQTVQDLLFHLPLRYEDKTHLTPIRHLRPGQKFLVEGKIVSAGVQFRGRRSLQCTIQDATGILSLRFFYFRMDQYKKMQTDKTLRCFGEPHLSPKGFYEMIHPEYQHIAEDKSVPLEDSLTPIYPTTEGLSQISLRKLIQQALQYLDQNPQGLPEWIPQEILDQFKLPALKEAILFLHRPTPKNAEALMDPQHPYRQRLAFEELLAHHLHLRSLRQEVETDAAIAFPSQNGIADQFKKTLPFSLTKAQERVIAEIDQDLQHTRPMMRLLQGDVGSGKTLVALITALKVMENGYQVALMAPTELLTEQHYRTLERWLAPLNIPVAYLTGQLKGKERKEALKKIAIGKTPLIIGTHALFQEEVQFHRLAFIIIDEQHRFGVHQRWLLKEKGTAGGFVPHQLVMTATPIPRTLAMTAYADLDQSILDEVPPNRQPIQTLVFPEQKRAKIIERIQALCAKGQQVYWVCPLIGESEQLTCQAAEKMAQELSAALPQLRIGLVHGRLASKEKESVMEKFLKKEFHILVATTVIEVGVDVPNATLMIIENAERLGLSQLHQLRGRVGRGHQQSYCILLYQTPLSVTAKKRIEMIKKHQDGFMIAACDLELRGPGELLGTQQTGLMSFRIADLIRDQQWIPILPKIAKLLQEKYSMSVLPIIRRWTSQKNIYGKV